MRAPRSGRSTTSRPARVRSVVQYDHYAAYRQIECPVLVLNVEEEVLYSYTVKAHAAIPHSEYVEIPGPEPDVRGWVAVVPEYPEEFCEAVMSFVDRIEGV